MTEYVTKQGDVLDKICLDYYGHNNAVETVLNANPGLAKRMAVYPFGVAIILPVVAGAVKTKLIKLWD